MDRVSTLRSRGLGVGLVLVLGTVEPGCSRWESFRRSEPPAVLGVQASSRDVYAAAHRDRSATPTALAMPTEAEKESFKVVEGSEVSLAIRPAVPGDTGVTLQAPEAIEPSTVSRSASPSTGVPNASILLASTERRTNPSPPTASITPERLVAEARAVLDKMTSYQALMHRQERVNGAMQPEEDVVLAVRRAPLAVRLSWPTGPHKGREVLYRSDEPGGLMHVNLADSALPIPRLSIPTNSPMALRNSRHPVNEAGFDSIVRSMEEGLTTPGGPELCYGGLVIPQPLDHPHHCLIRKSPSGEVSKVFLDPGTHLPALVSIDGPNGELLERYVFLDVLPDPPELASAEAFDPRARWGPPRGLFGRAARGSDNSATLEPR